MYVYTEGILKECTREQKQYTTVVTSILKKHKAVCRLARMEKEGYIFRGTKLDEHFLCNMLFNFEAFSDYTATVQTSSQKKGNNLLRFF